MMWPTSKGECVFPNVQANGIEKTNSSSLQQAPLSKLFAPNSNDIREFVCGWGAAVINVTVTYPINKIVFRQMLEGIPSGTAVHQLSQEGIKLLYRGILPPLCQKTLSLSIMFSVYEGCRQRLYLLTGKKGLSKILAANIAGTSEAILMPLERIQTLLQDWRYHNKFRNTSHAFKYILMNYGVLECYRGMVPIIYRNSFSNIMFFSLRDQSKILMNKHDTVIVNFISGAIIGGFTSTVFYPLNVIKVHMQSKIGGEFEKFTVVIREIYVSRNKSLSHFYKGVHLNYMRSFISWGVINASYDFLKKIVF
ncbi:solute carrier family 25 member 51 [Cephus cinctus]|uniref:Solute carrier family 25 member 51 n=1 Tax=Cephus cinctus TaxID=211228 RepID=A0AAJ7BUM9_CEPCN|nr:solute carrier family 25 member 51 [Cephus cinctus]XP_015594669.1 solute carrier family 25 member 51 [Cephus cinctus]XP_015594670.1 solute carrier family 25 member 51 [Cephus cinctus]